MAPSFLVTGATGHQGGSTAHILLKNNVTVHALVRNPDSEGAQSLKIAGAILFKGDFDDVASINAAIAGVTGVFLLPMPNMGHIQVSQARNVIAAAIAAKSVTTVVVSTSYWTGDREKWVDEMRAYYTQKADIEDAVRTAGFDNYTILRPSWLMHNYLFPLQPYFFPELAKEEAVLTHAYEPPTRMPHLDASDVGKFAAAALLDPTKFNGHEIELGAENLTAVEVAKHLSEASGAEVKSRKYTDSDTKPATLRAQSHANMRNVTIDTEKLQKDYDIQLTTFAQFLHRESASLMIPSKK